MKANKIFNKRNAKLAGSKVFATIIFPLIMYAIMAIICATNGMQYHYEYRLYGRSSFRYCFPTKVWSL